MLLCQVLESITYGEIFKKLYKNKKNKIQAPSGIMNLNCLTGHIFKFIFSISTKYMKH